MTGLGAQGSLPLRNLRAVVPTLTSAFTDRYGPVRGNHRCPSVFFERLRACAFSTQVPDYYMPAAPAPSTDDFDNEPPLLEGTCTLACLAFSQLNFPCVPLSTVLTVVLARSLSVSAGCLCGTVSN